MVVLCANVFYPFHANALSYCETNDETILPNEDDHKELAWQDHRCDPYHPNEEDHKGILR